MSNLVITKGYTDGAVLTKALLDTSFDDVSTWLNQRDNGTASWLTLSVSGTVAAVATITSNAATTTLGLNNTAADGDPKIAWQLSGVTKASAYVDDSDSDYLKFDNDTGTCLRIGQGATWLTVAAGTAVLPGIGIGNNASNNKGFYEVSANVIGISTSATGRIAITTTSVEPISDLGIDLGTTTKRFNNVYQNGMVLVDGVTAPGTISGHAIMYVDTADGDLKIKFGDGTVKTITVDS